MNAPHKALPYLWEKRDIEDLASARSFAHIGEITLKVLWRSPRRVTMISGPISSGGSQCREKNIILYRKAMDFVKNHQGKNVFNQLPSEESLIRHFQEWLANKGPEEEYCWALLEGIYAPLFASKLVERLVFMPGWHTSTGSKWEHDMACHYGISIEHLPKSWIGLYEARLASAA